MKLANKIIRITAAMCPLILFAAAPVYTIAKNADKEVINQMLSTVFPRCVTAQDLGYKPVYDTKNIDTSTYKTFDTYMRTLVNESCNVIDECWGIGKDFISEGSGNKIHHYIPQLEALETEIYSLVKKNETFLKAQGNNIHEAHRQILDVIQTILVDLIQIANITRDTISNKKHYLIKKGKPSAARLCGTLLTRLDPYLQHVDTYLDKAQYVWDLTVQAGHNTLVDPLLDTMESIVREYRSNPAFFSEKKMGIAIQHKLK